MTLHPNQTPLTERQSVILYEVETCGYVTIETLAARFGVSAQTIRRDIIALSNTGRVQRFHGGAGPIGTAEAARLDYGAKREIGRPEKAVVGKKAAAMVPDGAALFLDVGTTIEACARELARRGGFTVFTNSMRTAMTFDPQDHKVHVLGGRMAGRDGSLVGENVIEALRNVQLDFALIACSAVDDCGRVMDFDLAKIAVKRAAMAASQRSFLLATRSKFRRSALGRVGSLEDFHVVVTEELPKPIKHGG